MARYGQAFKDKALARLLAPESAALHVVAQDLGVGVPTLERWREQAHARAWMR
jgi:transposase-like protein